MATESITRSAGAQRRNENSRRKETERFEQRLGEILEHATAVFYERGFEGASMRDLSRASGMSLAGLYYYFESKDRLLYLIQKHTFETVLRLARERLAGISDPEGRVRAFIFNHIEYFLKNRKAMTVLSHEDETLLNEFGTEIAGLKRQYYRTLVQLVDDLRAAQPKRFADVNSRIAALALFGMLNWIYTWHNPRVDADAKDLARQMSQIFLNGVLNGETPKSTSESKSTGRKRRAPA